MNANKTRIDQNICFWLGVAVISLINIALYLFNKNQIVYDAYIFGISIIILIIFTIILIVKARHERIK
jgi:hypothetical protein